MDTRRRCGFRGNLSVSDHFSIWWALFTLGNAPNRHRKHLPAASLEWFDYLRELALSSYRPTASKHQFALLWFSSTYNLLVKLIFGIKYATNPIQFGSRMSLYPNHLANRVGRPARHLNITHSTPFVKGQLPSRWLRYRTNPEGLTIILKSVIFIVESGNHATSEGPLSQAN